MRNCKTESFWDGSALRAQQVWWCYKERGTPAVNKISNLKSQAVEIQGKGIITVYIQIYIYIKAVSSISYLLFSCGTFITSWLVQGIIKDQKLCQNQNLKWRNFAMAFILNLVSITNTTCHVWLQSYHTVFNSIWSWISKWMLENVTFFTFLWQSMHSYLNLL